MHYQSLEFFWKRHSFQFSYDKPLVMPRLQSIIPKYAIITNCTKGKETILIGSQTTAARHIKTLNNHGAYLLGTWLKFVILPFAPWRPSDYVHSPNLYFHWLPIKLNMVITLDRQPIMHLDILRRRLQPFPIENSSSKVKAGQNHCSEDHIHYAKSISIKSPTPTIKYYRSFKATNFCKELLHKVAQHFLRLKKWSPYFEPSYYSYT